MLDESGPIRNLNRAAFMIHSELHKARPDVLCAAHTHSIYGRAFSTLGRELDILTQSDCVFYDVSLLRLAANQLAKFILSDCQNHAVYTQFNGVVLDEEEGKRIAECAGPYKRSVILQNHGLITMSATIEGTIALFKMMEETSHCQLLAHSAAAGLGIKPVIVCKFFKLHFRSGRS